MPVASEAWVTRQFRALSAGERRRFLAAVWAARGYETSVEDEAVLVHCDETQELRVVGRWPWGNGTADVFVGLYDSDRARSYADAREAGFVAPSTLSQLLLYGIERSEAKQITREYFGTSLTEAPSAQDTPRLSSPASLGVLTVVLIAVVAASLGSVPTVPGSPPAVSGSSPDTDIQTLNRSSATTSLPRERSCSAHVSEADSPSTNESTSSQLFAEIHQEQLAERPQQVTFSYTGPKNTSFKSGIVRDRISFRSNGSHTRYVRTQTLVTDDGETIEWTDDVYVDNQSFWLHRNGETRPLQRHIWDDLQRALVWPYLFVLRTAELNVTQVQLFGKQFHRVTVRTESVERRNFSGVAYLTPCEGLDYLSLSYVHSETGEPVSLEIAYDDIDTDDPITPPSWYRERTSGE